MKRGNITMDEWLAEIRRLELASIVQSPDGFTSDELADKLNICQNTASCKIKRWIKAGFVKYVGTKVTVNMIGRRSQSPAFQFVGKGKKK
jgi:hypothetical protein